MSFSRPLCRTEKVYLVFDEICPGFANQFFFEGSGVLDLKAWKNAVEIASAANPGSRLVLKGTWAFTHWVDSGITPRVREIECPGWDGLGPEGGPSFLNESLPSSEGPTCEVILMHGNPLRVVFRTHHAVMDGRGTFCWIEDIFRALNGQCPLGSSSRLTELEMAKCFQKKGRTPPPAEFIAPTGMPRGMEPGVTWRRMRIPGRYKNLLGQVAVLLAGVARQHGEGKIRFGIPVDLRPRKPGLRSTGNLTNLIYLEMNAGRTPKDIAQDISGQLEAKMDGMLYWGDRVVPFIPYGMLRHMLDKEIIVKRTTGRYRNSGILSNIGRIPMEQCSGGGFTADYYWAIPPGQEMLPIFAGLTYSHEDTTLIISIPRVLANEERIDALMDHLKTGLEPSA